MPTITLEKRSREDTASELMEVKEGKTKGVDLTGSSYGETITTDYSFVSDTITPMKESVPTEFSDSNTI